MKKVLDWRFLVIIALFYFVYHFFFKEDKQQEQLQKNNIEIVPQDSIVGLAIDVQVSKEYSRITMKNWQEILKREDVTLKNLDANQKLIEKTINDSNKLAFMKGGNFGENILISYIAAPATKQSLSHLKNGMEINAEEIHKQGFTFKILDSGKSKFQNYDYVFIFTVFQSEELIIKYSYMYILEVPPYSYMIYINSFDKATIEDAIISITPK